MSRIEICYTAYHMLTQTVSPTLPGFQGIKCCIRYMASNHHETIFCPSTYYDVSNAIRLTWSGDQVEYYTTHNFPECHKDAYRARILNRIRLVSGVIHTLLGISVF